MFDVPASCIHNPQRKLQNSVTTKKFRAKPTMHLYAFDRFDTIFYLPIPFEMLRSVKLVPRAAIFVFLFFFCSDAEVSIERIEICLSAYTKKDSTNAGKKSTKLFHLHFGDPVVEVLNALTSFDALRIKALSNCVKQEDSFLFEESK